MNAEDIPPHIRNLIDTAAGKQHSTEGTVLTTLAKILTEYGAHMNAAYLATVTNEELITELNRRHLLPRCRCDKHDASAFQWSDRGYTWRCNGCRKTIYACDC